MAVPSLAGTRERPVERPPSRLTQATEMVVAYGPAAIILALPLEFTSRLFGQPLSRWLTALVSLAFAYLVLTRRRTLIWPRRMSALVLGVFVLSAIGSWLLTRAPGSYKVAVDIATYPVIALVLMNLLLTAQQQRRAWTAFLVSGLAVALIGIVLYATHLTIWAPNPAVVHRLNITFADPNITARFLTLCAVAAVMLYAARQSPAWLCAATASTCALVVPMTWSRSGLALFMVAMVVAFVVSANRRRAAALIACSLLIFVASTTINPDTRGRAISAGQTLITAVTGTAHNVSTPAASKVGDNQDTFALQDNRRYLIAAATKMFLDHPIVGVGFGGYQHQLVTNYRRFIPTNNPKPDTVSHTAFVTIAAEQGVIGILLMLAFLVALAWEALRSRRNVLAIVAATVIVPIVLYSQFEARLLEEPYLWVCLALFYGAIQGRRLLRVGSHTI